MIRFCFKGISMRISSKMLSRERQRSLEIAVE